MVYGAALHRAVQEFHRRHARGDVMTEDELIASFEAAWSNEGFLSREHEEARLAAGRETLRRFREAQLEPGATIPAWVEREFTFSLGGDRIRGRWDRVDIEPVEDTAAARPRRPSPPHADARRADLRAARPGAGHDHRLQDQRRPRPGQGAPARPRLPPAPDLRDGL